MRLAIEPALWTSMRGLGIVCGGMAGLLMSVLLAGCATAPVPKSADFSFHTSASPFDIHWKLSVDPSVVQADGLIERHNEQIGSARVQLLGLDAAGRIVSFTTPILITWVHVGPGAVHDPAPPSRSGAAIRGARVLLRVSGGARTARLLGSTTGGWRLASDRARAAPTSAAFLAR